MIELFTKHLKDVNETYLVHFKCAASIGLDCCYIGLVAFIHAVFPFLHTQTASDKIIALADKCRERQKKAQEGLRETDSLDKN